MVKMIILTSYHDFLQWRKKSEWCIKIRWTFCSRMARGLKVRELLKLLNKVQWKIFSKTFLQWLIWNCFALSYRNYVHRAFASVPESCKDQMEAVLKQKLTSAFAKSESWAVDWEKEPLPMLVICVRLHSLHILPLKLEVY